MGPRSVDGTIGSTEPDDACKDAEQQWEVWKKLHIEGYGNAQQRMEDAEMTRISHEIKEFKERRLDKLHDSL